MRVVHYTKPPFVLHSIKIMNGDGAESLFIKPKGALWCSPLDSIEGWADWCRENDFGDIDHKQRVIFDIDTSNFVVIDNANDMENKLVWYQVHKMFFAIDFEKMVEQGIEGIHLTVKGQWATRFTHPRSLYGWDCETILILNDRCIKNTEK